MPKKHRLRTTEMCGPWCVECQLYDRVLPTAFLIGVLVFLLYFVTLAAPLDFPSGSYMKVSKGDSATVVAKNLAERHLIRSQKIFVLGTYLLDQGQITPGEYFFPSPQNVITVARRLIRGDFELVPIRVTIPEGTTVRQMEDLFTKKLADFDSATFVELAQSKEGYLFPDTYFFLPGSDPVEMVESMESNFKNRIASIATTTGASKRSLHDLVIMASLLEKEASDMKSRRMIAGILWHRIDIGMLLQVDAVFPYIIGKNTFEVSLEDLRVDSPYNTYKYKGLPVGPINNPGLDSIIAAATPIKSSYVYYLSDSNGNFHYATTYAQHLVNKKKYVNSQ